MSLELNDDELLRYSRQILLPQIDVAGQLKLKASRALIVGLGGLGSPVALYLAAAGVGELQASQASQLPQVHWHPQRQVLARPPVGAGLLAMAAPRLFRQTELQASQASQLPQVHWHPQRQVLA